MPDDVIPLLKVHQYFHGLGDELLREVLTVATVTSHPTGEVVHKPEDPVTSVGFLLRGRLKAVRLDSQGRESLLRIMERGSQFGLMVGVLAESVPVRVFCLEPSILLTIDYEHAMELTIRHVELRRHWLKTYAGMMRQHFFGATAKRVPKLLALLHGSNGRHGVATRLAARLQGVGETIAVIGDSDEWHGVSGLRFRSFREGDRQLEPDEIRRQVIEWVDATRIIFDIQGAVSAESSARIMELADRIVYFVPSSEGEVAVRRLKSLDVPARGWRDKVCIAWILDGRHPVAPCVPNLRDYVCRDFKIVETEPTPSQGKALTNGLERLVHHLRGIRIGLALGGGAAHGMSHLGVMKALERHGIVVDMIAGTSAGALTGAAYASGLDCDYSARQFSADLRPPWLFRHLFRGNHWFLLYQYRRGHFDPMLRKYLHDWKLEQLAVPCLTVTVDLVSGQSVVREQGDAVHSVLESINLPVLSVPIIRDGQALIDGGLINNIPADVLVSMGCNFVIAVSVTAKMEKQFCDMTPDAPNPRGKKPSTLQTILRSMLVQNHSLNAFGVRPADVVIEPDVTGFDLTEFMRAKELAAVGERDTLEQIPKIKQLLTRLDPELFRFDP